MKKPRALSHHARNIISVLADGDVWRHGYELSQKANVRSGTLYPLLLRLESQGVLEAEWRPSTGPGRPPRHVYRLTGEGRALAQEQASEAAPARGPVTPLASGS
jgi:DNA-binding PadR family transcriptional regulator